ncbi:hypothetical protein R1T16_07505 [Flavobacterium sp. DG1-102-2]|uniref:hypothetical protein n=1 Tax=Flavobacterium sp. DG1-102-2 TaxID=3081663 RepID=UPI002948FFF5|nr:hypothetical protein [Flavobacterium sp. DG1-102-2]MDV6168267.1 hypothetical protein [Flavobacterium sp. DG1-102-2]
MKFLVGLNYFAIGVPIILGLLSIKSGDFAQEALVSTMLTGALQVLIALILFARNPNDKRLYGYFAITITFFILWLGFDINEDWLFAVPPALAAFLTYIVISTYLHEKKKSI